MDARMDYSLNEAWPKVTALFDRFDPRPAARCGNVRCEPDWHWRVDLTDYDLWLAVAGRGRFVLEGRTFPIRPGTLFWLRPGHSGIATQEMESPLTVIYVHFDFFDVGAGQPVPISPDILPAPHIPLRDASRLEMLLARVVRLQQVPTPLDTVEAHLLLKLAMLEAYRQVALNHGTANVQPDPRIAAVLTHLHRNPAQRLSLPQAASLACLSTDHFSRLFRASTGTSFRRYAVETRLARGRHLLEETTLTVGEVAQALGYADVFLFSRQFKTRYGVAPSRIRTVRAGEPASAADLALAP